MSKIYRVALLIDTSTSWGSCLIKGVSQFAREHGDWLLYVEPHGRYEQFRIPQGWSGDGIIARINRMEFANEVVASGLPAINVSWYSFAGSRIIRCSTSEQETGFMAADYFLSIGFRQFAYCGPLKRPGYNDHLAKAYCARLEAEGHVCHVYSAPLGEQGTIAWNEQLHSLVGWLKDLPTPTGLLCWSAVRGRQLTEACHYAGLRVPNDIAVLGGDHDDLMSMISSPPLSTIGHPAERIGVEGARLLQQQMDGANPDTKSVMFSPIMKRSPRPSALA